MTVVYNQNQQRFSADDVLWAKRELVDAIVRAALISQTEGFIDMIVDGQEDMSRNGIQDTLKGVKDSAIDFLEEVMTELKQAVEQRVIAAQYGAAVTGIKYDLAGEVKDVEVDVTVSFPEAE